MQGNIWKGRFSPSPFDSSFFLFFLFLVHKACYRYEIRLRTEAPFEEK